MPRSIRAAHHVHFHVPSATSTAHAIFLASLCAFLIAAFLIDLHRGVTRRDTATAAEQHQ